MKLLFSKKRNFQTIIDPLWDIEIDLSTYIEELENEIYSLEEEKKNLGRKIKSIELIIKNVKEEKEKTIEAIPKISELLSSLPFSDFKFENSDF